jgi:sugar lactone lactonase YvrE
MIKAAWGVVLAAAAALSVQAAEPQYLLGIAVADGKTVYLADRELPGIWQVDGGKLTLLVEGSKKFRTPLNAVRCLAIDHEGKLLAGDSATRDVYRIGEDKQPQPLTKGEIGIPMSIAVNKAGEIFVADLETHRIWKVPAAGGKPEQFAEVQAPRALAMDSEDRLWVVSHGKDQLLRAGADGKLETIVSGRPMEFPSAVAVDATGVPYICDTYAKAVWKVNAGKPAKLLDGAPLVSPVGMTWLGPDLAVVDPRAKAVFRVDPAGKASKLDFAQ